MAWLSIVYFLIFLHFSTCNIWNNLNIHIEKNAKSQLFPHKVYLWNEKREEFISLVNESYVYDINMNSLIGKTLYVDAVPLHPYLIYNNETNEISGFLAEMWSIFEEYLYFKTEITIENLDVAAAKITEGLSQATLTSSIATTAYPTLEFSQPYFHYNSYNLFTRLPEETPNPLFFLRTLSSKVWYACVGMFTFLTICQFIAIYILNYTHKKDGSRAKEPSLSLISCFLVTMGGFWCQGIEQQLNSFSTRSVFCVSLLFGYSLYSVISAILVSEIAFFDIIIPYKSIEHIVSLKISICARETSAVYTYLENQAKEHPDWAQVFNGPGCPAKFTLKNMKESICYKNVMIWEALTVMTSAFYERWPCGLLILGGDKLFKKENSLMLFKGFKERKLIYFMLERIRCNGILDKLQRNWFIDLEDDDFGRSYNEVTFQHIEGIMKLYFCLLLFSLIVFIIEYVVNKINIRYSKRKQY